MEQKKKIYGIIILIGLLIGILSAIIGITTATRYNNIKDQISRRYQGYDIKIINIDKLAEDPNGIYYKCDIIVYYENTKTIRNVEINKVEYIEKSK